jgi:molybdopterin converting factor small subunit
VATSLGALFEIYPGLRDRLLTEQGKLRPHVALFVGPDSIRYTGGFDTPVSAGDQLTILPAVSGG